MLCYRREPCHTAPQPNKSAMGLLKCCAGSKIATAVYNREISNGWDKMLCYRCEPTEAHERTLSVRDAPKSGFLTAIDSILARPTPTKKEAFPKERLSNLLSTPHSDRRLRRCRLLCLPTLLFSPSRIRITEIKRRKRNSQRIRCIIRCERL